MINISTHTPNKSRSFYKVDRRNKEAVRRAALILKGNVLKSHVNLLYTHISENVAWGTHTTVVNKRRYKVSTGELLTNISHLSRETHMGRPNVRRCLSILQDAGVIKVEKRPKYAIAISINFQEPAGEEYPAIHAGFLPPSDFSEFLIPPQEAQGFQEFHLVINNQMKNSLLYREEEDLINNINIYRPNLAEPPREVEEEHWGGEVGSDWESKMLNEYTENGHEPLKPMTTTELEKKEIFGESLTLNKIAKGWLDYALANSPWVTPPRTWTVPHFEKELEKVLKGAKLTLGELFEVLGYVSTDPFWKHCAMAPNRLLKKSTNNDFRKIDNIIIAMKTRGRFKHGLHVEKRVTTIAPDQQPW